MTDRGAEQDWIRPNAPDAPFWMNADQAHGWACGWEAALDHYRSLPVEQRMEAMGMVPRWVVGEAAREGGGKVWVSDA